MKSSIICGFAAFLLMSVSVPAARAETPESRVEFSKEPVVQASLPKPEAAHPFAQMAGAWSGGGTIELTGDIKENLRCRANYVYGAAQNSLALSIRCASDNYKFELTSNVVERRGQISGTWSEAAYKVSGQISGHVQGNHIAAIAKGDSFTSDLAVTTTANRMMVTMTPQATYVIAVKMAFSRVAAAAR
jgi:hypothetical protein